MNQNKTIFILSLSGLFLLVTGLSYFIFGRIFPVKGKNQIITQTSNQVTPTPKKTGVISFSGPKTEICPLNGALFTKEEKDIWSTRRPLTVMIENHADSRPQSGLNNADIVYEAVAEGGITRFLAVFYCAAIKGAEAKYDLGPVRSARTYYLDLASEYADYPLYAHVGGANCSAPRDPVTGKSFECTTNRRAMAIEQIQDYKWTNKGTWSDLNQFSLSYKVCRREPERTGTVKDTEHTMFCSSKELWNIAKDRGLTSLTEITNTPWDKKFVSWSFKAKDQPQTNPDPKSFSFDFWPGYKDYSVTWAYDQTNNRYLRNNGGQPHIDFNDQQQLSAKNVIIQYVKETRSIDQHLHNLYDVIGKGNGLLFKNGQKIKISWSKAARTSRTIFKDEANREIEFVPGNIWVEILPLNSTVTYENTSQP